MDTTSVFNVNQSKKFTRSCIELIKALGSCRFATDATRKFTVNAFEDGTAHISFPGTDIEQDTVDILHVSCSMAVGVKSEIPIIGIRRERIYTGTERIEFQHESKQLAVVTDSVNILGSQNLLSNAICYVVNDHDEEFVNTDNTSEKTLKEHTSGIPSTEELNFIFNLSAAISTIGPVLLNKNNKYLKITYTSNDKVCLQMDIQIDEGLAIPLSLDMTVIRDDNAKISVFITTKYDARQSDNILSKIEAHFATVAMEEVIPGITMKLMNTIETDIQWIKNNEL